PHRELEADLAGFLGTEAALAYVSCWNANEALIPILADQNTVLLSDELNHASLIDAMRLARPACKLIYKHSAMEELEAGLKGCDPGQRKVIVTDGVFSMEGDLARLPDIVTLARKYDAIVVVDDSHGTGVMGPTGRGVAEHFGLLQEVDIVTSTLGKALGGAAGGFVAGPAALCDVLAQRSRPQLFSNALPPTVACSARRALQVLRTEPKLVARLQENTRYFRGLLQEQGLRPLEGESAIVPILVGETAFAIRISRMLLEQGVFVTGFGFPVVPEGTARIRVQMSAALAKEQLEQAAVALGRVAREVGLL
ncbi:MAG: aminotransferase class I/II-fold pyridoxal phosphate-dependent enzyme, partial [Armatimonadetes bacterium]|nr:aminotransferase class I/II-fold pyridoxal phosphate-dependent enzyme [Armatimonadota bacterium]